VCLAKRRESESASAETRPEQPEKSMPTPTSMIINPENLTRQEMAEVIAQQDRAIEGLKAEEQIPLPVELVGAAVAAGGASYVDARHDTGHMAKTAGIVGGVALSLGLGDGMPAAAKAARTLAIGSACALSSELSRERGLKDKAEALLKQAEEKAGQAPQP
jgi:hypothetical protein